jgi:PAS domain-containing protein
MQANREIAAWLVGNRREIEAVMNTRLGSAAPRASGPEAETLRRFRTFAASALMRSDDPPDPALDGLRPNERRVMALLATWVEAAGHVAGPRAGELRRALAPLVERFRLSLRSSASGRRSHGAPRASRRAVTAAIDRVCDAFLAIDVDGGTIADANPAAGAVLGVPRDALLGLDALAFVPECERTHWWSRLDAVAEGGDAQHFPAQLQDVAGVALNFDASITRFATRGRTLALLMLRPRLVAAAPATRPEAGLLSAVSLRGD